MIDLAAAIEFLSTGPILAAIALAIITIPLDGFKFARHWWDEFMGTVVMIVLTFCPGKWIGAGSWYAGWFWHWVGVVVADYTCGGPQVNPAVSSSMLCLGKITYTHWVVNVAGQMAGGLIAFPLCRHVSSTMAWTPLGGPAFDPTMTPMAEAAFDEFIAALLLLLAIYALNWEYNFGEQHYLIKQSLTAFTIRALIQNCGAAGPAINPMLATTWAVFAASEDTITLVKKKEVATPGRYAFPSFKEHYLVYWIASIGGALVASALYSMYTGNSFFGARPPFSYKEPPKEAEKSNGNGKKEE